MQYFRSEEMTLCEMLLHKESAFDCLAELGTLGAVQFDSLADKKHVSQLQFHQDVERCTELQRILRHLQTEIEACGLKVTGHHSEEVEQTPPPRPKDLNEIERLLQQLHQELVDVERNHAALRRKSSVLLEKWHVLRRADEFLHADRDAEHLTTWTDSVLTTLLHDDYRHSSVHSKLKLRFFAGSIPIDRLHGFEVMLWRLCRGNFFMRHAEISEPLEERGHTDEATSLVRKFAFVVFFQGGAIREKIAKVCQGFAVALFECPESRDERTYKRKHVAAELEDLKLVLAQTDQHRTRILLAASADLVAWKRQVQRILRIYFVLNRLSPVEELNNERYLRAECWIPTADVARVRRALVRGARRASKGEANMMFPPTIYEKLNSDHAKAPPTFFRLNRFTRGFQNLIDAYGVAVYQELNPAPYTIVTFPFLFAVMFGDIGHGLIMAIFSLWMVLKERQLERRRHLRPSRNEIWNLLFAGRYVILLMGLFSIYTGFIYNEFFSKSVNLFGSQWRVKYKASTVASNKHLQLDPSQPQFYLGTPYVCGMDPVWDVSGENSIIMYNSLKMKLAIILGVGQMLFGLILSARNHVFSRNVIDLYLVCVPQMVFLLCLFFYMVFLIFHKWSVFGGHNSEPYNSGCAPSILITFIDMMLMKGSSKPTPEGCEQHMYIGQGFFQRFVMVVAGLCIPVLLAGKPLLIMVQRRRMLRLRDAENQMELKGNLRNSGREPLVYNVEYNEDCNDYETSSNRMSGACVASLDMTELWISQGIYCIESVLGTVSHTASYLRLWALSLAHDQLSSILWKMVLTKPLAIGSSWLNGVLLYFAFCVWAVLTVAILVVMEGLSAFLHTLRLHWVEFQSKFYAGSGELFCPFRFDKSSCRD